MVHDSLTYTPKLAQKIIDMLCDGVTIEEIARMKGFPSAWTIHSWKSEKHRPDDVPESFAQDIARAREIGYDLIAARLRKTARGRTIQDGGESTLDIQRDKLIVDTDLKLLAKWSKQKYGDKIDVTSGDKPLARERDATDILLSKIPDDMLKAALKEAEENIK